MSVEGQLSLWQRGRFALGDLAFNFYWQSVTLYLLFYYTDVVGLPIAQAGLLYMLPSIWDGIVDFAVGLSADRLAAGRGGYRRFLVLGALPLGAAFVLLYLPLPFTGSVLLGAMLGVHLLFRTLYAAVNVPYSALTARITTSSRDRASIAGLRMLFGTVAAVVVALATQPIEVRSQPRMFPSAATAETLSPAPVTSTTSRASVGTVAMGPRSGKSAMPSGPRVRITWRWRPAFLRRSPSPRRSSRRPPTAPRASRSLGVIRSKPRKRERWSRELPWSGIPRDRARRGTSFSTWWVIRWWI